MIARILVCLSFLPCIAVAGVDSSGGGKGVVCRDASGAVRSVELLDLWEAREIYQRKVLPSALPISEQVSSAIDALRFSLDLSPGSYDGVSMTGPEHFAFELHKTADLFLKNASSVQRLRGVTLTDTPDSYEPAFPNGCKVEQLVNFMDSVLAPRILVNQDLVDHLDPSNEAALITHEAFYVFMRDLGETDSIRVRRSVGYVFSGNVFSPLGDLTGSRFVACYGAPENGTGLGSTAYFYFDLVGKLRALESYALGRPAVGFFPGAAFGDKPLEYVLGNDICNGVVMPRQQINYQLAGKGPVDFQSLSWLIFDCNEHSMTMYLSDQPARGDGVPASAEKLSCRMVQK